MLRTMLGRHKCLIDVHHYGNDDVIHLWNLKKQGFFSSYCIYSAFFLSPLKNYLVRKHNKSSCLFPCLKLNKKAVLFKAALTPINSSNIRHSDT